MARRGETDAAAAESQGPIPTARLVRTGLRTLHLIAVAALYGGHVYGVDAARLVPALAGAVATGSALALFEAIRAPVWLVQVRGVATFSKLALVAAVAPLWEWRVALLTAALVIGAVASHMPGRWRYYSLRHGRVAGSREAG